MSTEIPKKFCTTGNQVIVHNVAELKAALAELPDDLPVHSSFSQCACVVVYNVGASPHLELEEPQEEEEEEEVD
jgi:hypothetical protein